MDEQRTESRCRCTVDRVGGGVGNRDGGEDAPPAVVSLILHVGPRPPLGSHVGDYEVLSRKPK